MEGSVGLDDAWWFQVSWFEDDIQMATLSGLVYSDCLGQVFVSFSPIPKERAPLKATPCEFSRPPWSWALQAKRVDSRRPIHVQPISPIKKAHRRETCIVYLQLELNPLVHAYKSSYCTCACISSSSILSPSLQPSCYLVPAAMRSKLLARRRGSAGCSAS